MLNKSLITASLCLAVSLAHSQAKIIDSQPMSGQRQSSIVSPNVPDGASRSGSPSPAQVEMYYQLQLLQEEVQQLRGLVEEQAYELKQLKQQRLDDYLDLDRRIGQKSKSDMPMSSQGASSSSSEASTPADTKGVFKEGEFASYQAAIALALKQRDFAGAILALQAHLEKYPSGSYAANTQYWLGQIHFQEGDLEQSRQWFSRMTQQFPDHQKASEAKLKLGKVLYKLGEKQKAKALLQEVAGSGSSASSLASEFLKQNF